MRLSLPSAIAALAVAVLFTGCCCLGKMTRNADAIKYEVVPSPLEMHCDEVAVELKATVPPQYFDRKVTLEITPALVGDNGTVARFKPFYLQGEKVAGNNPVINRKEGGNYTYSDKIPYQEGLEHANLELDVKLTRGNKERLLDPRPIGVGTIVTPYLLMDDDKVLVASDKFKRITNHTQKATVNYLQNSAYVRPSELRQDDIKEVQALAEEIAENEAMSLTGVSIEAYASPEGELRFNENLADDRAETARKVIARILRREKLNNKEEGFYTKTPKGEDWLGFKAAMEKSDIKDKELILRILTMYDDLKKREQEIRNLSKTYTEVADKILPGLRRSTVMVNYQVVGKTDAEILELARTNPVDLNVEEMLYAATLTKDNAEKLKFYTTAQKQFPKDFRGFNNAGVIEFNMGNVEKAESLFNKAKDINASAEVHNNLGVIARLAGDRKTARDHFEKGLAAGEAVKYNVGILDLESCKYGAAAKNFNGAATFNNALALHLDNKNDQAIKALQESGKTDGMTHYLYAIIYAHKKDDAKVMSHLKDAIAADASLKAKAAKDREFYAYRNNPEFTGMVK